MTEMNRHKIIRDWWWPNIGNRNDQKARGLAARLRRAGCVETLAEPAVHELARDLNLGRRDADRLVLLAQVLSEVREHDNRNLAAWLGAKNDLSQKSTLSQSRFERLIRAAGDEIAAAVRRALPMVDRKCNVGALGVDLLAWNDKTRARWCFEYYGAEPPQSQPDEETEA